MASHRKLSYKVRSMLQLSVMIITEYFMQLISEMSTSLNSSKILDLILTEGIIMAEQPWV